MPKILNKHEPIMNNLQNKRKITNKLVQNRLFLTLLSVMLYSKVRNEKLGLICEDMEPFFPNPRGPKLLEAGILVGLKWALPVSKS